MHTIYLITNKVNGKKYVGQTRFSAEERFNQHISTVDSQVIHKAMQKYGSENFLLSVIETCEDNRADEREIFWIKELNTLAPNGYNITRGGNGTVGYKFTEEDKKKISQAAKRFWQNVPEEERDKRRERFIEIAKRPKTEEQKRAISEYRKKNGVAAGVNNPFYGKKHSEETKKLLSKIKKKPVICIHKDGTREYFDSLWEAGLEMERRGHKSGNHYIWLCLKGYQKTAYGYYWEYATVGCNDYPSGE